jgi:hypothetical protein
MAEVLYPLYQGSIHESELDEDTEGDCFVYSETTSDTCATKELKTKAIKKEKKYSSIKKRRPS